MSPSDVPALVPRLEKLIGDGSFMWVAIEVSLLREIVAAWREAAVPPPDRELATEIVWSQDAADLVEMAHDWPLPTDDGGAMFSGDVLIHKLGNALKQALEGRAAAVPRPESEPDESKQCGAKQVPDGWSLECTRTTGHEGAHVAHWSDRRAIASWEWHVPTPPGARP